MEWLKRYFDLDEHPGVVVMARVFMGLLMFAILLVRFEYGGWPWDPTPSMSSSFWDGWYWIVVGWVGVEIGYAIFGSDRSE